MQKIILIVCLLVSVSGEGQDTKRLFQGKPTINEPSVVGNYPGTPFLFAVPTSGKRPITWTASGLPKGLILDAATGIISGMVPQRGLYTVHLTARNKLGTSQRDLLVNIGDTLALTPPMGWNSWNLFGEQLTDALIREVADSMVSNGMRDLGYQYVNIDDFWQLVVRDKDGNIQINRKKFPQGIKAVADYVHARGLKLGIYSDAGELTCGGVAGSNNHEVQDARDFANWGVDLLKYDYCGAPPERDTAIARYTRMANALRQTNRSIVFSVCEWGEGGIPPYGSAGGRKPEEWAPALGASSWRTTLDIRNHWALTPYDNARAGIANILDINAKLADYAGPGHWNDPDMLVVGIYNSPQAAVNVAGEKLCTHEEYRSHMGLWSLMAAPLLCGNDIRNMNQATKELLLNPEILAINQDRLGRQAKKVKDDGDREVYAKPMADGSWAVGLLNRNDTQTQKISVSWRELGLSGSWKVRDVWRHQPVGTFAGFFETSLEPHQSRVIRIYPAQ